MDWGYDSQKLFPSTMLRFILSIMLGIVFVTAKSVFAAGGQALDNYTRLMELWHMLVSGAASYVPWVAAEKLCKLLGILLLVYLVYQLVRLAVSGGKLARLFRIAADCVLVLMIVLCGRLFLAGYQAYRMPAHIRSELYVSEAYSIKDLYSTGEWLLEQADALAGEVPRNAAGASDFGEFGLLAEKVCIAFNELKASDPAYYGVYAPAKAAGNSDLLNKAGQAGYYCALTGECVVNGTIPGAAQPYTAAVLTAKRLGIIQDAEAELAALKACRLSNDRRIQYSGYLMAFRRCYLVLSRTDAEMAAKLLSGASNKVLLDMQEVSASLTRERTRLATVYERLAVGRANAFGLESGNRSEVTSAYYLIALYQSEN